MEQKFDVNFLIEQIVSAKLRLKDNNISEVDKQNLEEMIDKFTEYLENKKKEEVKNDDIKTEKDIYKKLNDKFSNDLKLIDLDFWKNIIYLYNNIDHSVFETKNNNSIQVKDERFFDLVLFFYKNIDKEYYHKALQIIQAPTSLINFDTKSVTGDECFYCEVLKLPFINISSENDDKYMAFVHELQHGIDSLIKGATTTGLLNELSPIFIETLFIDFLNKYINCEELYNFRINHNMNTLHWLNAYAQILVSYDKTGRKITKFNIKKILQAKNKEEVQKKYEKLIKVNFINSCRYMLSFMISVELRNYYHFDKQKTIKNLKDSLTGKYNTVDFNSVANNYNLYIEEIRKKQEKNKNYQKTVNL